MKLIVNGCSYTAGNELKIPDKSTWAYHLSSEFDSLTNLAASASSNQRIFRTTLNYISEMKDSSDCFFIIGWTQPSRIEFFLDGYNRYYQATPINLNMYREFAPGYQSAYTYFQYQTNRLADGMKTVENIISLQSLFKSKGIPYLMFNTFVPRYILNELPRLYVKEPKEFHTDHKVWSQKIKKVPNQLLHMIDEKNFIKLTDAAFSMNTYLKALNVPYGVFHPLEEGHSMWAYYLKQFIDKQGVL